MPTNSYDYISVCDTDKAVCGMPAIFIYIYTMIYEKERNILV